MKKFYITILSIVLLSITSLAQPIIKGVVFTTGGSYAVAGNHVKLYSFDYLSFTSSILDSVLGDYSNHIVVQSHYAYIHVGRAAGHPEGADRIFKYDLLNQAAGFIDSTDAISGIQKFEVYNDRLVITRGYPATSDYVIVVDKDDMSTSLYTDNSIMGSCDGITIENQKAYISATHNGVSGIVHVIELGSNIANEGAIMLDSLSIGAKEIYADNGMLYLTNVRFKPDYSTWYAGVTSVDLSDSTFVTDTTGLTNSKGFSYANNQILGDFGNPLENYNVNTSARTQIFAHNPTAVLGDPNGTGFAVQSTDYFSYGKVEFIDDQGNVGLTINTDISGSALAGVANFAPVAVNDTISGGALPPNFTLYVEPLLNDYDIDMETLKLESILNQPINGTVTIEGDSIKLTNATQLIDTVYYVMSDVWGDRDTAFISYSLIGSVSDIEINSTSVYPNPAKDVIQITTESGVITNVDIVDITGRKVLSSKHLNNNVSLDVSTLKNGVYFVIVESNEVVETHRVIIQ